MTDFIGLIEQLHGLADEFATASYEANGADDVPNRAGMLLMSCAGRLDAMAQEIHDEFVFVDES